VNKSGLITQSVKEWLESGDGCVPDKLDNLLQDSLDPQRFKLFSRRIAERYEHGSLTLHFHIEESLSEVGESLSVSEELKKIGIIQRHSNTAKYCAVAQFFAAEKHIDKSSITAFPFNSRIAGDGGNEIERLVLVSLVQCRKGTKRLIPTRVRLQTLDQCHSTFGNPNQPVPFLLRFEVSRAITNGERGSIFHSSGIRPDEMENEVIESRPDIVEEICNQEGELLRWLREMNTQKADVRFLVFLGDNFALAYGKPEEKLLYRFEMFICPDQFKPNAI
jgi:hypothetical protein